MNKWAIKLYMYVLAIMKNVLFMTRINDTNNLSKIILRFMTIIYGSYYPR